MNKISLFLSFVCLLAFKAMPFEYKNGDLIFQVGGGSRFSDAIESATGKADREEYNYVHVGIISLGGSGSVYVIEASPQEGVRISPLEDFLADSPVVNGNPGAVVMRVKDTLPFEWIVSKALQHIGEPYDWYYLPDNGMMYCSELVYETYVDAEGKKVFKSQPMNFRSPDGTMPEFWIDLYQKLGIDVPEGIPGTNPNDLSKDPQLEEIYRYF